MPCLPCQSESERVSAALGEFAHVLQHVIQQLERFNALLVGLCNVEEESMLEEELSDGFPEKDYEEGDT